MVGKRRTDDVVERRKLESIDGSTVSVPDDNRVTHLQFRRFAGCPMCNLHIHTFIRRHDELRAEGLQEVAVFHSSRKALLEENAEAPFAIISDPEKKLYLQFGVEPSLSSVLHPSTWAAGFKGMLDHGVRLPEWGQAPFGLPADFLIDSDGTIMAAKYGTHAYDHWEVDEVLELARRKGT